MNETLNQKLDRIEKELAEIKNKPVIKQINHNIDISKINNELLLISKSISEINNNNKDINIDLTKIKNIPATKQINHNIDIERLDNSLLSILNKINAATSGISTEDVKKLITVEFINNLYRNK